MKKALIVIMIAGCTATTHQQDEVVKQSIELHEATLKISQEVRQRIEEFAMMTESLDDSLKSSLMDSIQRLNSDWADWESSIVEVPGHEHEHDHHDHTGHTHDHQPSADLTPQMVLEIQQDLNQQIKAIDNRVNRLMEQLK